MSTFTYAGPAIETQPATRPKPIERIPENPDDPFGVVPEIIEEIEEIGRRYTELQR